MAVEKEDSTVMPSNIGSREVRTATKDMASGVERGRSWGEVRAEGAKGGAVCSKGNPVGFVDGVGTGRSPEGTIADLKNRKKRVLTRSPHLSGITQIQKS